MIVRNDIRLVTGTANRGLAQKIGEYIGVRLTDCAVTRFSDGEVWVQINENIRGADLFIFHGGNDRNVPIGPTRQLVSVLEKAGARVVFVVEPDKGHESPGIESRRKFSEWLTGLLKK